MVLPEIETKPREIIKRVQEGLLRDQLSYLRQRSPYYSALFRKNNIDVAGITTLEDLQRIPVTTKNDLQQHNVQFYCVEKNQIIDYITTSGTLGNPVTFVMTEKDLDRLAYNEALSLTCADGSSNEIYQLATTMDRRFMAGLAYFLGARRMGAGVVRVGNGIPEFQWDTIHRISPSALIVVPSFLLKLIEYAEANGLDYRKTSIRKAVCIGEALREPDFEFNAIGKRISEKWDIRLFSTYASTEMGTAFTECDQGKGCHHHPELIIVECLGDDDNPVREGEAGELTVTTLGVEGMPLLRFKTGDICHRHDEPCPCGRTTMRLGPVIGRKQQMIKYKGTTLFPPALYDILNNISGILDYYVEVYSNDVGIDEIVIHVGCNQAPLEFEKTIKDHFRTKLRVAPQILFEPIESIHKIVQGVSNRKEMRLIDKRRQ
jgi:phenylacetate-CoA ligase